MKIVFLSFVYFDSYKNRQTSLLYFCFIFAKERQKGLNLSTSFVKMQNKKLQKNIISQIPVRSGSTIPTAVPCRYSRTSLHTHQGEKQLQAKKASGGLRVWMDKLFVRFCIYFLQTLLKKKNIYIYSLRHVFQSSDCSVVSWTFKEHCS